MSVPSLVEPPVEPPVEPLVERDHDREPTRSDRGPRPRELALPTTRITGSAGPTETPDSTRLPKMIGRFLVLRPLGRGGVGEVFLARDSTLTRHVAVKLLRPSVQSADQRERLIREAQAMALIAHPNVASVYEIGVTRDRVFVAMEYIPGWTLRAWQAARAPSWRQVLDVYIQAARGLAAAHRLGLVHRDVKPSNIVLGFDGRARVLDFGLVALADETRRELAATASRAETDEASSRTALTREGSIMGTPDYMAPEQFAGRAPRPATDQFGFCVALYEALYGERPFTDESYEALAEAVSRGRVLPRPAGSRVPRWLHAVVVRGLSVEPGDRHASMDALITALERGSRRVTRRGLVGAALLGAAVCVGLLVAHEPSSAAAHCQASPRTIDEVWSVDRRERVERALSRSRGAGVSVEAERALDRLDAYRADWSAAYLEACTEHARGELADERFALRIACLDRQIADFARATRSLNNGVVDVHAIETEIPATTRCTPRRPLARAAARHPSKPAASVRAETQGMIRANSGGAPS
ncbi:MAG: serine/threonine protein kinase [Myxococcales bacterium]|nr:serine/threonine protein kinase [Myxococcales bacterium]